MTLEFRQDFRCSAASVAGFLKDCFACVIQQNEGGKTFAGFPA
jgi:hypothetical protein